jgi:IS30 family transposase
MLYYISIQMHHLDYEKRVAIQTLLLDSLHKHKQYQIARSICVCEATISNELKWFKQNWIVYNARSAQDMSDEKRVKANKQLHERVIIWTKLERYIHEKIVLYRSPEQISKVRNNEQWDNVSRNTIYTYIYQYHPDRKRLYLRRKWKKYKHGTAHKIKILNRISIDDRPKEVDVMSNPWNLEWDTIVWTNKSDCIITLVDRKSSFLRAMVVQLKPWENLSVIVSTMIWNLLSGIEKELVQTLTLDNWTEFADHEYITTRTWTKVYFAHPYHSRERGLNENTNWLLRQFLPKQSSFKNLSQEQLDYYVNLINNRPRKKLNRQSPADVFGQ